MAKAKLNPLLHEIRGAIKGLVVKQTAHGTIITPKPDKRLNWSEDQKARRVRLKEDAREFYYDQMSDPARAARYRARAKAEKIPVSALVMGGFMKHGAKFAEMEAPDRVPGGETPGRDGDDNE